MHYWYIHSSHTHPPTHTHPQASALIQTKDEAMSLLLYEFLANASEAFIDVFPLM